MFVDIHTHKDIPTKNPTIRNLTFSVAEKIFSSTEKGYFSLGFHPWFADESNPELFIKLEKWASDKRLVAIGECGLDKNSKVLLSKQLQVFEMQIALSEKVQKPLIIHCVGCFNELFELKKRMNPHQTWLIHGFRGKPELAEQALKAGCSLSFGEYFNINSVRITSIDKLFMETDESKLPIEEIYQQIATIKGCRIEELSAGDIFVKNN